MYKKQRFLAIIPARGGSKRLPRKNILELQGKPLIAWTIEAALKSQYIDKVLVSSDDDEILDISTRFGAEILKRPAELATDSSSSFDVIQQAIMADKQQYDFIVLLQPTSPLRTANQIDEAIELLESKQANAVVSVCAMEHSPLWSNTLPESDSMAGFLKDEIQNKRSQELETYYRLNGAIYICRKTCLLDEKSFFLKSHIYAYRMDRHSSVDIDEAIDFEYAQFSLRAHEPFIKSKGKINDR